MPNTRRRRFSVQNNNNQRNASKVIQNESSIISHQSSENNVDKITQQNPVGIKSNLSNTSPHITHNGALQLVLDNQTKPNNSSSSLLSALRNQPIETIDREATATFSEINVLNILHSSYDPATDSNYETVSTQHDLLPTNNLAYKHPRQHRIKVRSPKRRPIVIHDKDINDISKRTVGTNVYHREQQIQVEIQVQNEQVKLFSIDHNMSSETDMNPANNGPSNHSLDDMCRICHGGDSMSLEVGPLISACTCRGTVGRVHVKCLERWLTESGKSRCELCGTRYVTQRVHKYGVAKAMVMWLLSQNAKQLMVDSLGIMLMSPLAVLAAWLSGRTLAGLMNQESHLTPWPLASTFVLACMTLVCYYCWIVSAATRHALAWWIWYRSQYEVRLQLQDNEE